MSQLIEYHLFDEQTMSRVVSANGKSTESMSLQGPSPRSHGHWRPGSLLLFDTIVRPRAAAVGAPGGDAGGCRGLRLVLCVYSYSNVWSCVWPPEYLSSKPVAASSLPDEAVW